MTIAYVVTQVSALCILLDSHNLLLAGPLCIEQASKMGAMRWKFQQRAVFRGNPGTIRGFRMGQRNIRLLYQVSTSQINQDF